MSHLGDALRDFPCGPGGHDGESVCGSCSKDEQLGCCGFCNCCGSDEYLTVSFEGQLLRAAACTQCATALRASDDSLGWSFVAVAERPEDDP